MKTLARLALAALALLVFTAAPASATISGVTITAGGGSVTLDSGGIEVSTGSVMDGSNTYQFSNGAGLWCCSSGFLAISTGSSDGLLIGDSTTILGNLSTSSGFEVVFAGPLSGGGDKAVCADNNGQLFYGCVEDRIGQLEAQIRDLQSLVRTLTGAQSSRPERIVK